MRWLVPTLWVVAVGCATTPQPGKYTPVPRAETGGEAGPLDISFDGQGKSYSSVFIAGEFNKWKKDELRLTDPDGDFVYRGKFEVPDLKPGRYAYKLIVDKGDGPEWIFDPSNTRRKTVGGEENSLLVVPDCHSPRLTLDSLATDATTHEATITASLAAGACQDAIDWSLIKAKTSAGAALHARIDEAAHTIVVQLRDRPNTKTGVWIEAGDAEPLYVPVWTRFDDFSFAKATLYFAFTDRFANGDEKNDGSATCLPKNSAGNWLGGDWAGLTAKIDDGYFEALGVDALWISAPNENPSGCYKGGLGRQFTAYHAYFPTSLTDTDPHFGSKAELSALVEAAHAKGIRVLIDFVANHLHEDSPLVAVHRDWFNPLYICGWDKPLTCWFEPYLPDLNYGVDAAMDAQVTSALHWIQRYDLDGFRVDAAKHIGHPFVHTLRAEIAARVEHRPKLDGPAKTYDFYTVGETFTGGWSPGDNSQVDMIKEWISDAELTGQFDFPLWYETLWAFGKQSRPLSSLKTFLQQNVDAYGTGAVMSSFIDNHDVPRFITHADNKANKAPEINDTSSDEAKALGWSDQRPLQPTQAAPYRLAEIAYGFVNTQPAIPLIYYGDEIGLPGAGDPDNRRMMQFSALLPEQQRLLSRYQRFAALRKAHPALRSKQLEMASLLPPKDTLNDETLVFLKRAESEEILVVIDRRLGTGSEALPVWLPQRIPAGTQFQDLIDDSVLESRAGGIDVPIAQPGIRFLSRIP